MLANKSKMVWEKRFFYCFFLSGLLENLRYFHIVIIGRPLMVFICPNSPLNVHRFVCCFVEMYFFDNLVSYGTI